MNRFTKRTRYSVKSEGTIMPNNVLFMARLMKNPIITIMNAKNIADAPFQIDCIRLSSENLYPIAKRTAKEVREKIRLADDISERGGIIPSRIKRTSKTESSTIADAK
jgi:hypothetical protein